MGFIETTFISLPNIKTHHWAQPTVSVKFPVSLSSPPLTPFHSALFLSETKNQNKSLASRTFRRPSIANRNRFSCPSKLFRIVDHPPIPVHFTRVSDAWALTNVTMAPKTGTSLVKPTGQAYKDKSKPADVRSSNINAARGRFCRVFLWALPTGGTPNVAKRLFTASAIGMYQSPAGIYGIWGRNRVVWCRLCFQSEFCVDICAWEAADLYTFCLHSLECSGVSGFA